MKGNISQYSILLVDDSSTNIALLEAILEDQGHEIIKALNVKDALHCLEKKIPHLILLDLLIPKISGFDFFQQIRSNKKTRNIPVIVISALSNKEAEKKALELGAVDFISKPVDIPYLIQRVETILQQ